MRIIPVLDVKGGRAVLARGGDRAHYAPVRSLLHEGSDPVEIALAYRDVLGLRVVYLADLDAIGGAAPALPLFGAIAALGMGLWVDAGARTADEAGPPLASGAEVVVAGLETLGGPEVLEEIVRRFGPERVAFSLDLRAGRPMVPTPATWGTDEPRDLAGLAIAAGVRRLILLDLARVGTGAGVGTEPLLEAIHADHPGVEVVVGGGVAGPGDLRRLEDAGASAALVGSALHDGRIGADDWLRNS